MQDSTGFVKAGWVHDMLSHHTSNPDERFIIKGKVIISASHMCNNEFYFYFIHLKLYSAHMQAVKPHAQKIVRSKFYLITVIDAWSQLPNEVVTSSSATNFNLDNNYL